MKGKLQSIFGNSFGNCVILLLFYGKKRGASDLSLRALYYGLFYRTNSKFILIDPKLVLVFVFDLLPFFYL